MNRSLGTADVGGLLVVKGEGTIGSELVDFCPSLRRSVVSLGRVHSWGLTAHLPPDNPELTDRHGGVLLTGVYHLNMPAFKIHDLCLLVETFVNGSDSVCAVTRSMDKVTISTGANSRGLKVWEGDKDILLPQRALTDSERVTLLHNRMGHIFA